MLSLYHGDTSVCSQKVRLVLAEKKLDWEPHFIDLGKGDQFAPDYLKLNPNAVVPTLVHDGRVIIESTMIDEYLDDAFPKISLRPDDPYRRAQMRLWIKQLDDSIHYAINTVTFAIALRQPILKLPAEQREARFKSIPDPGRREKMKELIELGVESPLLTSGLNRLDRMLADMEQTLDGSEWLTGGTYSLADAGFTPYVNRMAMLSLHRMWEKTRPRVSDWYERVKARPNYAESVLKYDPADRINLMQKAGEAAWPKIKSKIQP